MWNCGVYKEVRRCVKTTILGMRTSGMLYILNPPYIHPFPKLKFHTIFIFKRYILNDFESSPFVTSHMTALPVENAPNQL